VVLLHPMEIRWAGGTEAAEGMVSTMEGSYSFRMLIRWARSRLIQSLNFHH
jgi:hypothetical protein